MPHAKYARYFQGGDDNRALLATSAAFATNAPTRSCQKRLESPVSIHGWSRNSFRRKTRRHTMVRQARRRGRLGSAPSTLRVCAIYPQGRTPLPSGSGTTSVCPPRLEKRIFRLLTTLTRETGYAIMGGVLGHGVLKPGIMVTKKLIVRLWYTMRCPLVFENREGNKNGAPSRHTM